jgi:hypothetical protein
LHICAAKLTRSPPEFADLLPPIVGIAAVVLSVEALQALSASISAIFVPKAAALPLRRAADFLVACCRKAPFGKIRLRQDDPARRRADQRHGVRRPPPDSAHPRGTCGCNGCGRNQGNHSIARRQTLV